MGKCHLIVGALCAVALLGGCARASGPNGAAGGSMPESSDSAAPVPSELSLPPSASSPPGTQPATLTLTGQVEAGVEAGCLIMRTGGKTYLLLGGDPTVVRAGAQVSLTGRLVTNVKSYCMQGTPFQVSKAHPA